MFQYFCALLYWYNIFRSDDDDFGTTDPGEPAHQIKLFSFRPRCPQRYLSTTISWKLAFHIFTKFSNLSHEIKSWVSLQLLNSAISFTPPEVHIVHTISNSQFLICLICFLIWGGSDNITRVPLLARYLILFLYSTQPGPVLKIIDNRVTWNNGYCPIFWAYPTFQENPIFREAWNIGYTKKYPKHPEIPERR